MTNQPERNMTNVPFWADLVRTCTQFCCLILPLLIVMAHGAHVWRDSASLVFVDSVRDGVIGLMWDWRYGVVNEGTNAFHFPGKVVHL